MAKQRPFDFALPRADLIKIVAPGAPAHTVPGLAPGLAPVPTAVWLAELGDATQATAMSHEEAGAQAELQRVYAQASALRSECLNR